MAKKKKKFKETTIEDYYDLRSEDVDELVRALKGEETDEPVSYMIEDCVPAEALEQGEVGEYKKYKYKGKEFNPYKLDRLGRVPAWVIALVIKWWFSGMICWFVVWGLSNWLDSNGENLIFFSGLVMGMIVDLLVNPALHYFESDKKEYNNFMMFPQRFKAYWTFLTNIVYYIFVLIAVAYVYEFVNVYMFPNREIGMEPIFYGVFCVLVDMVFIGIKDLIVYLVKRNRRVKEIEEGANV